MGHEGWHEQYEELTPETRDMHRAIISLMEELEAVDWYQQRVDATPEDDLKAVLAHNRDEEIEHAVMTLEWIRRRNPKFDENLRTYLFSEGPITEVEAKMKAAGGEGDGKGGGKGGGSGGRDPKESGGRGGSKTGGSLGIGSLAIGKGQ